MGRKGQQIKLGIPISYGIKNRGFYDQVRQSVEPVINDLYDGAEQEAKSKSVSVIKSVYKQIIEQYYRYKTVWYDRHGEGVGTGTGFNLYRAYDAKYVDTTTDTQAMLQSGYLPSKLLAYHQISKTQPNPKKEDVFNYIMNGGRSIPPWATRNGRAGGMMFFADVHPVELNQNLSGVPLDVMEQAEQLIPSYFDKIIFDYFKSQVNRIKIVWR